MPEFTQSWAFWFLVVAVSFAAGFVLAIILAASGGASRMEEKIEAELVSCPIIWNVKNHFRKPEIEIITKNNPRTD